MSNQLVAGFSPFGHPSFNPIYPFNQIYDKSMNLINATENDLKKCDVVILWGGTDISPALYGEEPITGSGPKHPTDRDLFEWELIQRASERGIPIIGICRGAQMLCAAAGGKLVQHTNGHIGTEHAVVTYDNQTFITSSDHHQMMYVPSSVNAELLAWMPKNLSSVYLQQGSEENLYSNGALREPEVIFFDDLNALAIQCHPEWHSVKDPFNDWVFDIILERFFE